MSHALYQLSYSLNLYPPLLVRTVPLMTGIQEYNPHKGEDPAIGGGLSLSRFILF